MSAGRGPFPHPEEELEDGRTQTLLPSGRKGLPSALYQITKGPEFPHLQPWNGMDGARLASASPFDWPGPSLSCNLTATTGYITLLYVLAWIIEAVLS